MSNQTYTCKLCSYSSHSVKCYMLHCRTHRNRHNREFPCGFQLCCRTFKNYSAFRSHIQRDHISVSTDAKNVELKCPLQFCNDLAFNSIQLFFSHLKLHITNGITIQCPFHDCHVNFSKIKSFSSHISRYHKNRNLHKLSDTCKHRNEENAHSYVVESTEMSPNMSNENANVSNILTADSTKQLRVNMGLFYLKLYAKYLLPNSVIQNIVEQFHEINDGDSCHFIQ